MLSSFWSSGSRQFQRGHKICIFGRQTSICPVSLAQPLIRDLRAAPLGQARRLVPAISLTLKADTETRICGPVRGMKCPKTRPYPKFAMIPAGCSGFSHSIPGIRGPLTELNPWRRFTAPRAATWQLCAAGCAIPHAFPAHSPLFCAAIFRIVGLAPETFAKQRGVRALRRFGAFAEHES